jgi:rRNA maturation protein Rpf1
MNNSELLALSSVKGARTLVVIDSHMGNPSAISFASIRGDRCGPTSLKFRVLRVRLRREFTSKIEVTRTRKLLVLKSEDGSELERFTKILAEFLEGNLIQANYKEGVQGESGNRCVVLKTEKGPGEFILRFVNIESVEEYGPQITVKGEDFPTDNIGGSPIG